MSVESSAELAISNIAGAIGELARVRILYNLLDGRARTSTELAVIAEVSPSTTSVHLHRLKKERLVKVLVQGKHRYYSLNGPEVARALEAINLVAGGTRTNFVPSTPSRLLAARTCYDHLAGRMGVLLHDRFKQLGWFASRSKGKAHTYELTHTGNKAFESLGVDVPSVLAMRRRFAYACLDWSERQPHLGGALGAALLKAALKKRWVTQDLDNRALSVTRFGRAEMLNRFDLRF